MALVHIMNFQRGPKQHYTFVKEIKQINKQKRETFILFCVMQKTNSNDMKVSKWTIPCF